MSARKRKLLTGIILAAGILYAYHMRNALWDILSVFVYAALFSVLLSPLHTFLMRRGWSEQACAAASVAGVLLAALILLLSFFPYLIAHTIALIRRCTPVLSALTQRTEAMLNSLGFSVFPLEGVGEIIGKSMSGITASLARGGITFAAQAGRIVFALVISYYVLCERKRIVSHLILFLPRAWRMPFLNAVQGCRNAIMSYASGLIKTSVFISLCTYIGLLILGIEDAFLLAVFMGLFEIMPYIGPVLASIPILLSALEVGGSSAVLALGLIILIQQLEGSFISPYFTASSTSIHPLAALLSVYALGNLMGLWGILLAVPLLVVIRSAIWSLRRMTNLMKA